MRRLFLFIMLISFSCLLLIDCGNQKIIADSESISSYQGFFEIPDDSTTFYFPNGSLSDGEGVDTLRQEWYSKNLYTMKEPVLFEDRPQREIYRFTWLRTFDHPIVVRIDKGDTSSLLHWKVCNGAAGFDPGDLVVHEKRELHQEEWERFIGLIDSLEFWMMPTIPENRVPGTDGAHWILEGVGPDRYHVVDRESKDNYGTVCEYMLELTDLDIPEEKVY